MDIKEFNVVIARVVENKKIKGGIKMKYNQFAIQNNKGEYIQYPTAYNYEQKYTNNLYDVYLWDNRVDAECLANYMMEVEGVKDLSVVEV